MEQHSTGKLALIIDRLLFLFTALLAGYKIVAGMDHHSFCATVFHTASFGILILASLMLLLFGYELLTNPAVPIIATLIPMTLSLGLVCDYFPTCVWWYGIFISVLYALSIYVRFNATERVTVLILALVHGVAGLLVVLLPVIVYWQKGAAWQLFLVSLGGMLIGGEGVALTISRLGERALKTGTILKGFSTVLLLATAAFVGGTI